MGCKMALFRGVLLWLGLSLALGTGVSVATEGKAADTKASAGKTADKKASETRTAVARLTAAEIVDKHVLARGGLQAWRGVQALAVSGRLEAGRGTRWPARSRQRGPVVDRTAGRRKPKRRPPRRPSRTSR